jgi:hypothetical protein
MTAGVLNTATQYAIELLGEARRALIPLSLFGSIAVAIQTENCPFVMQVSQRKFKDIDLVSLSPHQQGLHELLTKHNWSRREDVYAVTEGRRAIYRSKQFDFGIDVLFDELDFCHRIDMRNRLNTPASDTISTADLLLSKLQWVGPRPMDIEDTAALLACHAKELTASGSVLLESIVGVLCTSWGFTHAAELNLRSVISLQQSEVPMRMLTGAGVESAAKAARSLLTTLASASKSISWRIRSVFGEALPWYRVVEPISEPF